MTEAPPSYEPSVHVIPICEALVTAKLFDTLTGANGTRRIVPPFPVFELSLAP